MTKEEILHLGQLARIRLTDAEVEQFSKEIDAVLAYVSQINEIVADGEITKQPGAVYNVTRKDEVTVPSGSFTEVLLEAMPEREGQYLKVPKILNPDS